MWLDKFKSAVIALFSGFVLCGVAGALALQLVSRAHHVTASRAAGFAFAQPLRFWPTDLAAYAAMSVGAGLLTAVGLFALFKDVRWTYRPRRVGSKEAENQATAIARYKVGCAC